MTQTATRRRSKRAGKLRRDKPTKRVGQRIVERLTEFAEALERSERISDKFTCHKIRLDLKPGTYDAQTVREVREMLRLSQSLFAKFLGVSVPTVRAWEQGMNVPSDMASRFLDEIRLNPTYWQRRLQSATLAKKGS